LIKLKKMLKFLRISVLLVFFIFNLSIEIFAQGKNSFSINNKTRLIKASEAENSSGKFSLNRTSLSLNSTYLLCDTLPVDLGFKIVHFSVDDNSAVGLPKTLQEKAVNLGVRFPAPFTKSKNTFMGLNVMPSWSSAGKHDFNDENFQVNFIASLIYRESNDFIIAYGMWLRPEYGNVVLPFLGIFYRATDRLTFNVISAQPSISYKISDKTKALIEFDFLSHEFEVAQGYRKQETVRISDWEVGLGLEHDFSKTVRGLVSIGWVFEQKYEYLNSEKAVSPEDSLYAGYKISIKF